MSEAPANQATGYLWCCESNGLPADRAVNPDCRCRGCFGFRLAKAFDEAVVVLMHIDAHGYVNDFDYVMTRDFIAKAEALS